MTDVYFVSEWGGGCVREEIERVCEGMEREGVCVRGWRGCVCEGMERVCVRGWRGRVCV